MKRIMSLTALMLASALHAVSLAQAEPKTDKEMKTDEKVLVVFFSRTGENYAVGDITKGNTRIVAEMIAAATNGELFEIVPEKEYPNGYNACLEVAKKEQEAAARPALQGDIAVANYDIVFIGYPNWWGDMPMPVYTFIERHDWKGKTLLPFCTHEGSGLGSTERYIAEACKGATLGKGLSVKGSTARNQPEQTTRLVASWLERLRH